MSLDRDEVRMAAEQCLWGVCFIPLDGSGKKFFGFSEACALYVRAGDPQDRRLRASALVDRSQASRREGSCAAGIVVP